MLLSDSDPAPVAVSGPEGSGLLLSFEHAGNAVPALLRGLGMAAADLEDHIGWDPGALPLARALAERLQTRLVAQPYSRLVIDCNRPWGAPDLILEMSDARPVPGNAGLDDDARRARWDAIHRPFHAALKADCARHAALLSVHRFTPRLRTGQPRRTEIGVLARDDNPLFRHLMTALTAEWPGPVVANDPYAIEDASDYTIPRHAEPAGLPHALIEVRNDLISNPDGVARMADALASALKGYKR